MTRNAYFYCDFEGDRACRFNSYLLNLIFYDIKQKTEKLIIIFGNFVMGRYTVDTWLTHKGRLKYSHLTHG